MITTKHSIAVAESIRKQRRAASLIDILLDNEFYNTVESLSAINERRELGSLNYDTASKIIQDYEDDVELILTLQKATIIFDFDNEYLNVSLAKKEINAINKIRKLLEKKIKEIKREESPELDFYEELHEANIYIDLDYLSTKGLSNNSYIAEFHTLTNSSLYEIIFFCLKILDYKTNRFLIRKAKFNDTRFSKEEYLSKTAFFLKECTPYVNPFGSLSDFAEEIDKFRKKLSDSK